MKPKLTGTGAAHVHGLAPYAKPGHAIGQGNVRATDSRSGQTMASDLTSVRQALRQGYPRPGLACGQEAARAPGALAKEEMPSYWTFDRTASARLSQPKDRGDVPAQTAHLLLAFERGERAYPSVV